jgi:hypothetical protein
VEMRRDLVPAVTRIFFTMTQTNVIPCTVLTPILAFTSETYQTVPPVLAWRSSSGGQKADKVQPATSLAPMGEEGGLNEIDI